MNFGYLFLEQFIYFAFFPGNRRRAGPGSLEEMGTPPYIYLIVFTQIYIKKGHTIDRIQYGMWKQTAEG